MSKIFLINENVLKSETILNDNVGSEFIRPAIEASQDIYYYISLTYQAK